MREHTHTSRFERELASLKEEGSSLLLVGTLPRGRFYEVGVQLLGDANRAPRRRVLVGPEDGIETQLERLSGEAAGLDGSRIHAIALGEQTRSAAAHPSAMADSIPIERVATEDPAAMARAVEDSIEQFERRQGALNPAELRVSIDGVTTLLKAHGDETVFRLVHLLNAIVKRRAGMIHYILPLERDGVTVRTLQTLFDAVVELRTHQGRLEQQWELLDAEISSDWVAVDRWSERTGTGFPDRMEDTNHEF